MAARSNPGTATEATTSSASTRPAARASGTSSAGSGPTRWSSSRRTSSTSARSRKPRMRTSWKAGGGEVMRCGQVSRGRLRLHDNRQGRARHGRGRRMRTAGIVLCGGRSSRMGRAKAWLPFGGEVMLARVVRLLGEVVSPIVVVAAPGQDVPPVAGVEVARDPEEGRGPLQGLAAGLQALQGRAEAAYLSSCDVPFLRPAFVRRMIDLLGENAACVPEVGGYRHPLAAVYRLEVADVVTQLLVENRLRPVFLFEHVPTRVVQPEELADVDPGFETLRNLNTAQEYEAALREAGTT